VGKPYGWSNVVRAFQRAVTKAELGEVRFHNLRDFYASVLIHMGHDPVSVARQLGHSDATTTLRVYAREFDAVANQEKIRAGLEARFGNERVTAEENRRQS
jgi:integrase